MSFSIIPGNSIYPGSSTASDLMAEQRRRGREEIVAATAYDIFSAGYQILQQSHGQSEIDRLFTTLPEQERTLCAEVVMTNLFKYFKTTKTLSIFDAIGIYNILSQNATINGLLQTETFANRFFDIVMDKAVSFEEGFYNKQQQQAAGVLELFLAKFRPTQQAFQHNLIKLFEFTPNSRNRGYFAALEILLTETPQLYLTDFIEPLFQRFLNEGSFLKEEPSQRSLIISTLLEKKQVILRHLLARKCLS
ncbi:unnamed protein product, partial [marine sediment metagenome]